MSDSFYRLYPDSEDIGLECQSTVSKRSWERVVDTHSPLLRLLTIAKTLGCNILPLTWGAAMDHLGEGATGQISQAPLNSKLSFAYKRFSRRPNTDSSLTYAQRLNSLYNAMICELIVLLRPEIYDHPNIVNLEGLCFELVDELEEVRPALVFRKANLGTLDQFLDSPKNGSDFESLVAICGEIAKGLRLMHISGKYSIHHALAFPVDEFLGIVHGDIKPQNVLVFDSFEGDDVGVKITDFGYASLGNQDDDLVKLARSRPWDAPEYSPRWLTMRSAKRMDVYSFGLLVLWLLFRQEPIFREGKTSVSVGKAFETDDELLLERLEELKESDGLLTQAIQLVSKCSKVNENLRVRLERVFTISLSREPSSRAFDMRPFVDLCCEKERLESVNPGC